MELQNVLFNLHLKIPNLPAIFLYLYILPQREIQETTNSKYINKYMYLYVVLGNNYLQLITSKTKK